MGPPLLHWVWHRGPTASFLAVIAVLISVAALGVPYAIDSNVATRDSQAASDAAAGEQATLDEAKAQGDALERIAKALTGANPVAPDSQDPSATSCRNGGVKFAGVWGPERPIYTDAVAPAYALFDSVRDDPNVGDERSLYVIKDASEVGSEQWQTHMDVQAGHTYLMRIFVRNDSTDPNAMARNTRISVNLPTCTGTSIQTTGYLSSNDTFPLKVYGGVALSADQPFNLAYVAGSASMYNNSINSPFAITSDDFLASTGQQLGFDKLDGVQGAGYASDVYFFFKIRPQFAQ
ncbi:hypothetical protein GCM10009563_09530 [Subtercola frigoramans]